MAISILEDVKVNESAYQQLRAELENVHWHQWVVISQGQLVTVALSREAALHQSAAASSGVSRLVRKIGEELPKVVRKL